MKLKIAGKYRTCKDYVEQCNADPERQIPHVLLVMVCSSKFSGVHIQHGVTTGKDKATISGCGGWAGNSRMWEI